MGKTPYGTKIIGRQPSGLVITRVFPRAEGGTETDAYEFGGHLRYGENPGPGEAAAIFGHDTLMTTLQFLRMKKEGLSRQNYRDMSAGFGVLKYFDGTPAVGWFKHANASGFAYKKDESGRDLFVRARNCDYESGFGGVLVVNFPVDVDFAEEFIRTFQEVLAAPEFEEGAMGVLGKKESKSGTLRVVKYDPERLSTLPKFIGDDVVPGIEIDDDGTPYAVYPHLTAIERPEDLLPHLMPDSRNPTTEELRDAQAMLYVNMRQKSNSSCFGLNGYLRATGTGQPSRVDTVRVAVNKSAELAKAETIQTCIDENGFNPRELDYSLQGSVWVTDDFPPKPDSVRKAHEAGAKTMVVIKGGLQSQKIQEEVRSWPDVAYIILPETERHFRHA